MKVVQENDILGWKERKNGTGTGVPNLLLKRKYFEFSRYHKVYLVFYNSRYKKWFSVGINTGTKLAVGA